MGISTGGRKARQRNEINVTPLVDVVLVLLIIFLVTMPMMMKQVTVDVPRTAGAIDYVTQRSVTVLLRADGAAIVNDGDHDLPPMRVLDLPGALRPLVAAQRSSKTVFVDYCDAVLWRDVVSTMDQVRSIASDKDHDDVKVALKMREKKPDGSFAVDSTGCPCDPNVGGDDPHSCTRQP